MNDRVKRLKERLQVEKYPICVEKARLVIESFRQTEGMPQVLRRAKAVAHYLDNKTIFIEDDEIIVGNTACKPMGMEAASWDPTWPEEDMLELRKGKLEITDEEMKFLRSTDDYWKGKGRTFAERQGQFYDDERLWPFMQSGILCPPWKSKETGLGYGEAGGGWGFGLGQCLVIPDFAKVLNEGISKIVNDAKEELRNIRYTSNNAVKKADFLNSVIVSLSSIIRIARRFASLAKRMATKEANPVRKAELEKIAFTCYRVPAEPATNFYEAIQSFWFIWVITGGGTSPGGRFDQFMFPFYKRDIDSGRITRDEVLELLECLRIKVMQLNGVFGGKIQRDKWEGMARWHNWVIGGVSPDGEDATNDLSYLILEAAQDCQTPHHTITVRVHEGTPEKLMIKALELVRTGIGMPAFIGDKSYIDYLTSQGVPLEDARNFALAGCLDVNIPGKSRINAFGMFIAPLVMEITMHNGVEPRTGNQLGPRTGDVEDFVSFKELLEAFKKQMFYFMNMAAEEHNISLQAQSEIYPEAINSSLMYDAIKVGRDALDRTLPFENGSALNVVGMINVADSLAAVKKLVFDEKRVTMKELKAALAANWQGDGYEEMRKMFLAAPKYGNDIDYVDSIAADLYQFWAENVYKFSTVWGGTMKPTAISITTHAPAGALTGATPDGRFAGETLADGTMSPSQGRDINGPTAVIKSAITINQTPFQATLLNMKLHPSALKSTEDLKKLADLIKTYFSFGGKHIQFNVVDKETLIQAQKRPENYRDLIVRVAGYSAYFTSLGKAVQDEIIARTEHNLA